MRFYNDEHLFKHMNEYHFICQLCRDKKNIIFYKEISHLVEHNKYEHYSCPYQECIDDMFVVFDTEEKLNSHLITKHRCTDAKNRIANFMFDSSSNTATKKKGYHDKPNQEAFNFTRYINDLKEKVKQYASNLIHNQNSYINSGEELKYYKDNHRVHNQRQAYGDNNNYQLRNEDSYNKNLHKNIRQPEDYFEVVIQKGNYNNNSYYNENNNYSSYGNYGGDNYNQRKNKRQGKKQKYTDNNNIQTNQRRDKNVYHQEHIENANKQLDIKIDYSFVFNTMFKLIKDYIINRLKSEDIKEEEFILPHEITYQLIIIIDKLETQKLYELNSLANFGIDIDTVKDIRNILTEGTYTKEKIASLFDNLMIKKILIIYKYFNIAAKKIDELFYKLGKNKNILKHNLRT